MQGRREDEGSLQIGDSFLGVPKRDDDRFILKIVSQIDYTVCGNHLGIGNCFLRVVPVRDHCGSNGSIRRFHLVPVKDYPQSCQLDIKKLEKSHFWCWTYTTIILVMARYGFSHLVARWLVTLSLLNRITSDSAEARNFFRFSLFFPLTKYIDTSICQLRKKIKDIMSGQVFLSSDRTRPLLSCPKRIRDKFVPFFTCGIFWASKRRRGGLKVIIWYLFLLKGVYFTKVNFVIALQEQGKVNSKCRVILESLSYQKLWGK